MKTIVKISPLFFLILLTTNLYSQNPITQGLSLTGLSATYSLTNTESAGAFSRDREVTDRIFAFRPSYGYALKDNFLLGLSLVIRSNRNETINLVRNRPERDIDTDELQEFGFSLYARWYYQIVGNFGTYVEPTLSLSWLDETDTSVSLAESTGGVVSSSTRNEEFRTRSIGLNIGLYYAINSRFLVESTIGNFSITSTVDRDSLNPAINSILAGEDNTFSANFVNTLRFDQILRLNYLF